MTERRPRWLFTCSCGWIREASSSWAADSAARLHRQLGPSSVEHVTRIEPPDNSPNEGGSQLARG